MEAIRLNTVIEKDGEISLSGLPYKKGEKVELIVLPRSSETRRPLTADKLRRSNLIGLWKDREDVVDSAAFARQLREQAENRRS
jgi:hypothetical protein